MGVQASCGQPLIKENHLSRPYSTFGQPLFKALAKRSRKWTQVENLGQLATPFGQALLALALTCDDLRSLALTDQICTQVNASFSPFGHPTQVNAS